MRRTSLGFYHEPICGGLRRPKSLVLPESPATGNSGNKWPIPRRKVTTDGLNRVSKKRYFSDTTELQLEMALLDYTE